MANAMAVVQQDSLVGRKIGRYHIASLLGRGRGAVVYSATDSVIGRTVAIKILDRQPTADPEATAQFLRDAEMLSQLRHPNILPIYEFDQYEDRAYIVRQHTDGGTLRTYLLQAGTLSVPDALALLRPIATALDYAHRQGFVHGNLRPSNILRTTIGTILLTDFSVPGPDQVSASAATTIVSAIDAPEYASPEQACQQVGLPSIDLYVLGVILYEVLTGRPPFQVVAEGDSARNVLSRHLLAEPPSPREYNAALGSAVEMTLLRALAKRPEDRYPSGAALLYALNDAYEQDGGRRAGRPGTGPLGQRNLRVDEAVVPTLTPSETPATIAVNRTTPPATAAGEAASAPLPLTVSGPVAERGVLRAPELAPAAAIAAGLAMGAGGAPRDLPADVASGSALLALSRPWLVVMVGFLALCAGLACGLFFAIW